jgi:SAM-dependent methyltransferase
MAMHSALRALSLCLVLALTGCAAVPEQPLTPPAVQQGKDVMFIPQPADLVEKMMDVAGVTPQDFVMDLGSGDGRNVIAAAKRGAQALGVEYNPELAAFSRRAAAAAGVADRARFIEGDMYEADISKASVLALFLIPVNLQKLTPNFLKMKPGSRIVINTYTIPEWEPDETVKETAGCMLWCQLYLYIVPARAEGTWKLSGSVQGELRLEQRFQMLKGTLTTAQGSAPLADGRLRGDHIRFSAGAVEYEGQVNGNSMKGPGWTAVRQ